MRFGIGLMLDWCGPNWTATAPWKGGKVLYSAKLSIKERIDGKFYPLDVLPIEQVTAKYLSGFQIRPVVAEFSEGDRKVYAVSDPALKGKWCADKVIMDWDSFCTYWQYKMMEYSIDLFSRLESREERVAIMAAEGTSNDEAHQYCNTKPMLYGTQQELEGVSGN